MGRSGVVTGSRGLGPEQRSFAIEQLKQTELDILVIGGGIVGAGCALDAATRGLETGLLEARDWASGTSSRSSKLIHGGIRYLEQLDFGLVREALVERGLLLQRLAPHLVKPVRFLYPLTVPIVERLYIGAGMTLYDLFSLTGGRPPGVPHHRHLAKRQLKRAAPGLAAGEFVGGLAYYDAQVDDARYVATLARTASFYGAHAASRVRVEGFVRDGARIAGVIAHDLESGEQFEIRASQVIDATGVWTTDTQNMAAGNRRFPMRASKGVHIVVPKDRFRSKVGLLLRTEKSVLFVIPWGEHWLIGTTDTDWNLDKAHPAATSADIEYLLERVNRVLRERLTRDDIVGVFAGLRPLLAGESEETSKLSREHVVGHADPGLVVVTGGKFTTYRVMASDAVDAAVAKLPDAAEIAPSATENTPLLGAEGYEVAWNKRLGIARRSGLSRKSVEHLLNRHGSFADDIVELIAARPELAQALPGGGPYLKAEVVYAATHEGALHLDDVLVRRTRIAFETRDRGVAAAPAAARLMAAELGWTAERERDEVARYLERVRAEVASQQEPDDASADRVRLSAPDALPAS